jgi:hypothetical protein
MQLFRQARACAFGKHMTGISGLPFWRFFSMIVSRSLEAGRGIHANHLARQR